MAQYVQLDTVPGLNKLSLLVLLVCLQACAVNPPDRRNNTPLAGQVDAVAMLAAHNRWRRAVGVRPLRWSDDLEQAAAAWASHLAASGCTLKHNQAGQNLFLIRSDGKQHLDIRPSSVVEYWAEEKDWYNHERHDCLAPRGRSCWHYTQLVWKDSRELGCAMRACDNKSQLWVCNYHPAGNYLGQRPY